MISYHYGHIRPHNYAWTEKYSIAIDQNIIKVKIKIKIFDEVNYFVNSGVMGKYSTRF